VDINDFSIGGEITVEGWVYIKSHQYWQRLLDFGNGETDNNFLIASSQSTSGKPAIHIYIGTTAYEANSETVLNLNQWYYLVGVVDGQKVKLYINGVLDTEVACPSGLNTLTRVNSWIGRSNWAVDAYFNGIIDEVRIWNRALSAEEIKQLAAGNGIQITPNPAPLGTSVTINASIVNIGNATATSATVEFYNGNPSNGGTLITTKPISNIAPGNTTTVSTMWTPPSVGNYNIYVQITNTAPQEDYLANNIANATLKIVQPMEMDATISTDLAVIRAGDTSQIKVHVTSHDAPLAGATVSFTSENGTTLSNYTIVTDANGDATTTLYSSSIYQNVNSTVTAIITKSGYIEITKRIVISILLQQLLSLNITISKTALNPGEVIPVLITVSSRSTRVSGANITLSTTNGGTFTIEAGLSDASGEFHTTYIAPIVIGSVATSKIIVRATKSGYTSCEETVDIKVGEVGLKTTITAEPQTIHSGKTSSIKVKVTYDGLPVENAKIYLSIFPTPHDPATTEWFAPSMGTTNENGEFIATFTAPAVSSTYTYSITADIKITSPIVESRSTSVGVTVEPKEGEVNFMCLGFVILVYGIHWGLAIYAFIYTQSNMLRTMQLAKGTPLEAKYCTVPLRTWSIQQALFIFVLGCIIPIIVSVIMIIASRMSLRKAENEIAAAGGKPEFRDLEL